MSSSVVAFLRSQAGGGTRPVSVKSAAESHQVSCPAKAVLCGRAVQTSGLDGPEYKSLGSRWNLRSTPGRRAGELRSRLAAPVAQPPAMISAAPLYSGVHNWTSADRVRMCGINEDRRTPLSDEESKLSSTQSLGCEERCVSSVLSKVDITLAPNQSDVLMLQEDGGAQVGAGQRLEEKPPDPAVSEPAVTAPLSKSRGKTRALEAKQAANMLDTKVQTASSKHGKKLESARTPAQEKAAGTEPPALRPADADPSMKQKPILGPGLQIAGQPVEASHTVVSSSFGTLTPFTMSRICFSATQVPTVQKLPLSFPTGTVLAPSQPLVYIPPANCGQPLSVATLPTTFGVTPTLTLPMLPACLQDRCLIQTPSDMHTHAFASPLGRPLTTDPKMATTESNKPISTAPSITLTNCNSIIPSTADGSIASTDTTSCTLSSTLSSALTALQTLSAHPTLPMVNVSPIALTTYSRTPSSLEPQSDSSSSSVSPLKSPPQLEREMASPPDVYEMPLDLSSKSHRHKHAPPNQRKTPPMPVLTPVHTSGKATLTTVLSRSDCNSQRLTPNTSSSVNQTLRGAPLVMFPDFLRNGDPGSPQLAPGSWIKNSAALISTIPGTYVGVANPVPASVLLNKDSNLSLNTDTRHLAKQEPISIIDQGEPKNSGSCGKKNSQANVDGQQATEKRNLLGRVATVNSVCPSSKDWTLSGHGTVHPKCPLNGKPTNSQVLPVTWSPYHQTSLLSIGLQAASTLHSNQGPPHRLPVAEYTLFPNILPAESNATPQSTGDSTLNAQLKNSTGAAPEPDTSAKARTCETLPKQHKSHTNKTLLAPKPSAGNHVLCPQPGVADRADCSVNSLQGVEESLLLNKIGEKTNCKDKIRPKLSCSRKIFGEAKPKNKVLASYMTSDQLNAVQPNEGSHGFSLLGLDCAKTDLKADLPQDQPAQRKRSHKKAHAPEATHCVQEVDLSKVKIERIDDDEESFGRLPTFNDSSWSPLEMPPITKVKARVKKEPGLRGRIKRVEELMPTKTRQPKSKCKSKQKDNADQTMEEPPKRKRRRRSASTGPEKKEPKAAKSKKEPAVGRTRRRRRKVIKSEPLDPEYDLEPFPTEEEEDEEEEETGSPGKRRRVRGPYKGCRSRRFASIKEEPEPELITPLLQDSWEMSNRGLNPGKSATISEPDDEGGPDGTLRRKKRRRQKNRKYQNGEYLTEKEEEEVSQCFRRRRSRTGPYKRKSSPDYESYKTKSSPSSRDKLRQGFSKGGPENFTSAQTTDKPAGKRKCKTKHLGGGGGTDEEMKGKGRRSLQSPKSSPMKSPRKGSEPGTPHRSRRSGALGSGEPIPPEARKLIVNKNAGETLLQRAARLGYKDVVLFCLQRDPGDINHRDNAGYTALHEACSRGWTDILQVLLYNGANVNCSAQDGTRPIHDAVVNDNIETVWLLLSYGADPTLATYSGQTPMKLASSDAMRTFLSDYLSDLRGRTDGDPRASWDFYSSSILDVKDEVGHDVLLDPSETSKKEEGEKEEEDDFLFEFSEAPLIPCYNLQVSLSSGPGNWFLISDVLKKMKLSSRIFQARYPHFEIASMQKKEFTNQAFTSQILTPSEGVDLWPQDSGETVELIRYEAELIRLLGSAVEFQSASS
ncbi:BCL-6 corepressor-like protein 1 isoform X3 [Rana temporaria]|uniref:BCL-6 corepressor-like protein 1 isoform X3 n=1 Tax=Rana temporaria TaxID=8407 RepID=UPI001AADC0E5|nr:BCL-6 corepressor-like protein 1 isoform X3 [Rana temporaria]